MLKNIYTHNLNDGTGDVLDEQQSPIVSDDCVRRRPTVDDERTTQRTCCAAAAGRVRAVRREVGHDGAVLHSGPVAVGHQTPDRRTRPDERQQPAGQLRRQRLRLKNGEVFPYSLPQAFGPELIPVYRQSARR